MDRAPIIIIEGSNLSGKSSVALELERSFVHSVAVTFHGYYHPRLLQHAPDSAAIAAYHRDRLKNFLPALRHTTAEELILNRFHATASVYLRLFCNIDEPFSDIEEELNAMGAFFVLVDFDDTALRKRMAERVAAGKETPWGDDNFTKIEEKRNLYRSFYENSKIRRKIRVDNSTLSSAETVVRIKNQTHNFEI